MSESGFTWGDYISWRSRAKDAEARAAAAEAALADTRRALEEIGKSGVCQKWDVGDCNDSDQRLSEWACAPCRARRALAATENVS